jgi:hypothetical protein
MNDEDFKTLIKARIKKEEVEFDVWFKRNWEHIKETENIGFAFDLFRSVALSAWRQRGLHNE